MIEVFKNRKGHYQVKVLFRPPMEDMFETVVFAGEFENIICANHFKDRVQAKIRTLKCFQSAHEALDLSKWTWSVSKATPCGFMHEPSTAQSFFIPTTDRTKKILENSL